eukprot:18420-Amorphochlora_amoeboformis.AAC.1
MTICVMLERFRAFGEGRAVPQHGWRDHLDESAEISVTTALFDLYFLLTQRPCVAVTSPRGGGIKGAKIKSMHISSNHNTVSSGLFPKLQSCPLSPPPPPSPNCPRSNFVLPYCAPNQLCRFPLAPTQPHKSIVIGGDRLLFVVRGYAHGRLF